MWRWTLNISIADKCSHFTCQNMLKYFFGLQDESIMAVILLPIQFIRVIKCVEKHWVDLLSIHTISSLCFFLSSNWMRNCSSSKAERYRVSWAFWNSMIWSNTARNWFNRDCKHTEDNRVTEMRTSMRDHHQYTITLCKCIVPCCSHPAGSEKWWCPGKRHELLQCDPDPEPAGPYSTAHHKSTPTPREKQTIR